MGGDGSLEALFGEDLCAFLLVHILGRHKSILQSVQIQVKGIAAKTSCSLGVVMASVPPLNDAPRRLLESGEARGRHRPSQTELENALRSHVTQWDAIELR
jgi:hypothetical protein